MRPPAGARPLLRREDAARRGGRYGRTVDEESVLRRRPVLPVVLGAVLPQLGFAVAVIAGHPGLRKLPIEVPSAAGWIYGALGLAAGSALLLLHRRAPGPAVLATGALEIVAFAIVPVVPFALLPVAVAVVLAMVHGARWCAVAVVAGGLLLPIPQLFLIDDTLVAARSLGIALLLLVALGGGAFLRTRVLREAEEAARREDRQRIAVEQERVRIARELHDVLAHSLSSISVQAGVGLHLAGERPEAAVAALEAIRSASGGALDEVRGVLGLLRGDDAPLAPEPDLDALAGLVQEVRRTGARVELEDRLQPRPPRPQQLALFRIAQESLTNARRHAPGAAVAILLASAGDEAVVRVRDRAARGAAAAPVFGNGLTGMRERAEALHGRLDVVVHEDGLEIVGHLPLPARVPLP